MSTKLMKEQYWKYHHQSKIRLQFWHHLLWLYFVYIASTCKYPDLFFDYNIHICNCTFTFMINKNPLRIVFVLPRCEPDADGQRCPCPVLVSFLSGFSRNSCTVSVCCPNSVRILGPDDRKKLSVVCLSGGQGRGKDVRTITVRERLMQTQIQPSSFSDRVSEALLF